MPSSKSDIWSRANSIICLFFHIRYGGEFARPLKSLKLDKEYYHRIKNPLDIPEIRQRMNNGDYDQNLLLFERDVLLMLTNALCMYHRDDDIHKRAQDMITCATELFTVSFRLTIDVTYKFQETKYETMFATLFSHWKVLLLLGKRHLID